MSKRVWPREIPCDRAKPAAVIAASAALSAIIALGAVTPAAAQDISLPQLLDRVEPAPPRNNSGMPIEGWAKVRYSVLADGTTADARVEEAMPPRLDTRAIVSAVKQWKFAPATAGGEPVDWHNNVSTIVFDSENVPLEPSPTFTQAYVEILELMNQQDYDKAKKQNQTLLERQATRLNEIGLAQAQAALLHLATSNVHEAYDAIRRATDPEVVTLQDPELGDALQVRFAIEGDLGHYESSLETFDRLAALRAPADDDPVKASAEAVRTALQSDAVVMVKGRVARAPWSYVPTRRTFGFTDVQGSIRGLQLECNRRKAALEYSADVEWSIPESWGACTLFVEARRDTTFTLVEFPAVAAE